MKNTLLITLNSLSLLCLGVLALDQPASASVVTVAFSGTINQVSETGSYLTSPVNIGDAYTAQMIYDTSTSGGPDGGGILYDSAYQGYTFSFEVTVDGITFESSATPYGQFYISPSEYQWDELEPSVPSAVDFPNDNGTSLIELDLNGGSHSEALPSSLNLSNYSYSAMQVQYNSQSNDNLTIGGDVTSLTTSASVAPEPAPVVLMAAGAMLIALGGRLGRDFTPAAKRKLPASSVLSN